MFKVVGNPSEYGWGKPILIGVLLATVMVGITRSVIQVVRLIKNMMNKGTE